MAGVTVHGNPCRRHFVCGVELGRCLGEFAATRATRWRAARAMARGPDAVGDSPQCPTAASTGRSPCAARARAAHGTRGHTGQRSRFTGMVPDGRPPGHRDGLTLATAAPAEVALALGLRGTLATLTAGSISGLTALVSAANHVGKGRSRACIAGGVELPGTRLGLGDAEGELAALFLLEPSATAGHWPSITGAELGFDPERPSNLGEPFASATTTLLRMASACADPRAATPIEISGRSPEGHWARFHLQW